MNNDIIFSVSITKISVNDKIGIPIGEPEKPVRTNVRKFHASLGFESSNKSSEALACDFYSASIRPSLILIVKNPFESKPWRNEYVTTLLRDSATQ